MIWQIAASIACFCFPVGWLLANAQPIHSPYYTTKQDFVAGLLIIVSIFAAVIAVIAFIWLV